MKRLIFILLAVALASAAHAASSWDFLDNTGAGLVTDDSLHILFYIRGPRAYFDTLDADTLKAASVKIEKIESPWYDVSSCVKSTQSDAAWTEGAVGAWATTTVEKYLFVALPLYPSLLNPSSATLDSIKFVTTSLGTDRCSLEVGLSYYDSLLTVQTWVSDTFGFGNGVGGQAYTGKYITNASGFGGKNVVGPHIWMNVIDLDDGGVQYWSKFKNYWTLTY